MRRVRANDPVDTSKSFERDFKPPEIEFMPSISSLNIEILRFRFTTVVGRWIGESALLVGWDLREI